MPREPQADLDAERALIGAAILDATVPARVAVTGRDFYRPSHETLWRAIGMVNGHADRPLALVEQLRATDELRATGGAPYVHQCVAACLSPAAAEQYATIVARTARLRRTDAALTKAHQIVGTARPDHDVALALGTVMDVLDDALRGEWTVNPATATTSWTAMTLDDALAGRSIDAEPVIGARTDGQALFYAGAVHTLSGEPESGKTWIALLATTQQLLTAHPVVYIDFEDTAERVVGRLLALGTPAPLIAKYLRYIRPAEPLDLLGRTALDAACAGATLAVVDGVTEAMTMHGKDLNDNTAVAEFYEILPRYITRRGPAAVMIDHVTKNPTTQGRWGIGGQHKLAGVDGAAYIVTTVEPFGRGLHGHARITLAKDRPGHVAAYALGRTVADFHLDATSTTGVLRATLDPPEPIPTDDQTGELRPTHLMDRVATFLAASPGTTAQGIEKVVNGKTKYVRLAVAALIREGYVQVTDGPRGAKHHTLIAPFHPDDQGAFDDPL